METFNPRSLARSYLRLRAGLREPAGERPGQERPGLAARGIAQRERGQERRRDQGDRDRVPEGVRQAHERLGAALGHRRAALEPQGRHRDGDGDADRDRPQRAPAGCGPGQR